MRKQDGRKKSEKIIYGYFSTKIYIPKRTIQLKLSKLSATLFYIEQERVINFFGEFLLLRYPILKAIYGQSHPEYSSYMYLLAPISLVILNPIGFIILEVGRANNSNNSSSGSPNANVPRRSRWHILFQVHLLLESLTFRQFDVRYSNGQLSFSHQEG